MFAAGVIVYFTPFYFPNGKSAPKAKYFIVLKCVADKTIVASLPTSKNTIPRGVAKSACIEMPDINLNAFVFRANQEVTSCGKSFSLDTFVYGHQLDFFEIAVLEDVYRTEGADYEIFGSLKPELFKQLLRCLSTSKSVKKKFVRYLSSD